jgi:hypothetical protein
LREVSVERHCDAGENKHFARRISDLHFETPQQRPSLPRKANVGVGECHDKRLNALSLTLLFSRLPDGDDNAKVCAED